MAKKSKKRKAARKKDAASLPKELLKTAETVMALTQNPIAREVAAAALTAGAAALARRGGLKPTAEGPSQLKAADVGALLAQGVAALLHNVGKPHDTPAEDTPSRKDAVKPAR